MLTDERGAKLAPFEKALLEDFDSRVVAVLINGDRNGYCDLTEAFVSKLLEQVNMQTNSGYALVSRIVSCTDFLTPAIVDVIFATQNETIIKQYLTGSRGYGMESKHIISLLELGKEELIELYFRRFATMILTDDEDDDECGGCFAPVVRYLKQNGLYASYRAKYMPQRFIGN